MDDDGLLLNFAAPSTSAKKPTARRTSGKPAPRTSLNGQGRTNIDKGIGSSNLKSSAKTDVGSAPTPAAIQARVPTRQVVRQAPAPSARQTVASAEEKRTASSNGSKQTTTASRTSAPAYDAKGKKVTSVTKPTRGTAVISSLFAGPDALQDTDDRSHAAPSKRDPTNAPSRASDFGSLQLDPLLINHLASDKMKISRPTAIQRAALPWLLSPSSFERDALLHAQTGSGKTLCYLLPIIQSLLPFCEASWIDRSCLGTLAIILAPTRELARQIYEVAEALCSLHLGSARHDDDDGDAEHTSVRRTRWIVPGLLSGGATKNHEKSRLRKGLPLVVATPGRLLDHLRNTAALDVGRLQWLVLDEADRLLQLGFEETLNDILKAIDGRRRAACDVQRQRMRDELGNQDQAKTFDEAEVVDIFGEAWWRYGRRTVLCSATLDEGVQVLAGKSLRQPRLIRSAVEDKETEVTNSEATTNGQTNSTSLAAPAQLVQNYIITPTKQRLIILVALLRRIISTTTTGKAKVMVFLSCTDSVDFHVAALAGVSMSREPEAEGIDAEAEARQRLQSTTFTSQLLPATSVFKLHGSLSPALRQSSLKAFLHAKEAAVLFCTSVASRGLDLDVSHVIQVDPPTERGVDEYLHRIGRTARAGQQGESWLMLLPNEEGCVTHYTDAMRNEDKDATTTPSPLRRCEAVSVLRDGFGGADLVSTQTRATDAQMALERWTTTDEGRAMLARKAYLSHLRAYATHSPTEQHIFAIAQIQLGHLAKAFALREAPGTIRTKVQQHQRAQAQSYTGVHEERKRKRDAKGPLAASKIQVIEDSDRAPADAAAEDSEDDIFDTGRTPSAAVQFQRNQDTEARMYAKVRELGRLHKRKGVMAAHGGADEFQIA